MKILQVISSLHIGGAEKLIVDMVPLYWSDIPVLLKSSDIIAMSSHFEGLSLSSIEGMADIILRLKEEPSYYRQIADRCMRRASEYDIRKTVDQYLQLYQSLL